MRPFVDIPSVENHSALHRSAFNVLFGLCRRALCWIKPSWRGAKSLLFPTVFLAASVSWGLTLAQIKTEIRRNIRDNLSTSQRYSDTILESFINEAQKDVVNATFCLQDVQAITLVAGTTYYDLANDFYTSRLAIYKNSSNRSSVLEQVSERSLYQNNPDWARQPGAPVNYMISYSTSGGANLRVSFIPIPTTSSTGTVNVYYYNQVEDMSGDTDTPFNGVIHLQTWSHVLVDLVSYRIAVIEGTADAAVYLQNFNGRMAVMEKQFRRLDDYNPSFSGSGPNR